ncbi:phosphoesterase [bacterium]|jgi:intracellular multiplication protein IcmT|nr:phosphoesterase [bacterium]
MIDPATHWRDSARPARFFIVDANIIYPILLFLFNISYRTLIILGVSFVFFLTLDRVGFTVKKTIRYLKVQISGKIRYRRGWWQ